MKKSIAIAIALMLCATTAYAGVTDPIVNEVGTYPIVKESIEITLAIKSQGLVSDFNDNYLTHYVENLTGIDLNVVEYPDADAETKLMLQLSAGDKLPDLITFGPGEDAGPRNTFVASGALMKLDAYFDRDNGLAGQYYARAEECGLNADRMLNILRSADGGIYAFPCYTADPLMEYRTRAFINQDWLDAVGMKAPTTIDELTQVLIAFRDGDPNGNGIKDEVPMTGVAMLGPQKNFNPMTWLQNLFIYHDMTEDRFMSIQKIGDPLDVSYDKDAYREFLKYANMLVKEDLLDELTFTQTLDDAQARFKTDVETIGFMIGDIWMNSNDERLDHWVALEQPIGHDGTRTVTLKANKVLTYMTMSADCEHPEAAFLLGCIGYVGNRFMYLQSKGEEGVNWRYAEDGEVSALEGMKPTYAVLKDVYADGPQNVTWAGTRFGVLIPAGEMFAVYSDVDAQGNRLYGGKLLAQSYALNKQYAPPVCAGQIVYTEEEVEKWGEIRSVLYTYLEESNAKFAVGQLDPNSDDDWNAYLAELNKLNYKGLLEMDNAAYLRTNGITQ